MASAAVWLEELGIPPREVCLDWAWQIQLQFANIADSVDEETTELPWQRIEVYDTGELVLRGDLQQYSPDERLQELLNWARSEATSVSNSGGATCSRSELECTLRQLTESCVAGCAAVVKPVPKLQFGTAQIAISEILFNPKLDRPRATVASANSKLANQMLVALKRNWLVTSVAALILIAGCFIAWNAGTGKRNTSARFQLNGAQLNGAQLTGSQLTGEAASGTSPDSAIRDDRTAIGIAPELDDSEGLASLTELPQFGVSEPERDNRAGVAMPNVSSALLAGLDRTGNDSLGIDVKGLEGSESEGAGNSAPHANTKRDDSSGVRSETETATASELTERDVMQELKTLTETAVKSAVESDMAVRDTGDSKTISEPLMLRTSPMVQTQKVAAKIKVRPRQPVWQILLSVDDEFELTPKEPQDSTDRQIATWFLSDPDSKRPKVRLVIQAQAAPGRQTALRWRIFAGAEDLPELMLPLEKEILQPLQERLRVYTPMAQLEADRLKQLASVAEKDVRTVLNKQRGNLESQVKLTSRLSTILAEVQLLDDLLRSQLTVYAKLRDNADPDAPPLLQFGDPSDLETRDDDSKPPVAAH